MSYTSYSKQNFQTGDLLYARDLNEMDAELVDIRSQLWYVTPEMYGATGNGTDNDGPALQTALLSGKPVILTKDLYISSSVIITDTNVQLDGRGHRIVATNAELSFNCPEHDDDNQTHALKRFTETSKIFDWAPYHAGYISYNGLNPTPARESYDSQTVKWWNEHSLDIRNLKIELKSSTDKCGLKIYRYTGGRIENVHVTTDTDGMAGIVAQQCVNFVIDGCSAEGFTAVQNTSGWGYGIFVAGNNITVSNGLFKNCKNDIACCSDYGYFSTGIKFSNCTLVRDIGENSRRTNGDRVYQQALDCHGSAHNPIFDNIHIIEDTDESNTDWALLVNIRCPYATLSNIDISYPVDGCGYIAFDEFAEEINIFHMHAENVMIRPDNGSHLESSYYANHGMRGLNIHDSDILGVANCKNWIHVNMSNTRVHGQTTDYNYLKAIGCEFVADRYIWSGTPVLNAKDRTILIGCVLHYPAGSSSSHYLIRANQDTVTMRSCIIYGPQNPTLFNKTQTDVSGNTCENFEAFYLGELVAGTETVIGDSALDENDLV